MLPLLSAFIIIVCLTLGLAACANEETEPDNGTEPDETVYELSEYPVTIGDVVVSARPSRVVSLSPALTEKLYDIGLDAVLAGVSDYCDFPSVAATFTKCGTGQIPNIDRILALEPHVVLAQVELSNLDTTILAENGITVVIIRPSRSVREWLESYVSIARLLEGEHAGTDLGSSFAQKLQSRINDLENMYAPHANEHGRKKVLYLRMLDFTVATGDTLEHELMNLIGLDNIAAYHENWHYPEELAAADGRADFEAIDLLFMDDKFVTITMLEQNQFYRSLQATIQDRYIYIDSLVLERQSLRTLNVLERMGQAAYPDISAGIPFIDDGGEPEDEEDDE